MSQNTSMLARVHFPIGRNPAMRSASRIIGFIVMIPLAVGLLFLTSKLLIATTAVPLPPVSGTLTPPGEYITGGEVLTRAIDAQGQSLDQPDTILIPLKVGQPYTLYAWGSFQYCLQCANGPIGNAINGEGLDIFNVANLKLADTYTQPPYDNTNILAVYTFIASGQPLKLTVQGGNSPDFDGGIFYQLYRGRYE